MGGHRDKGLCPLVAFSPSLVASAIDLTSTVEKNRPFLLELIIENAPERIPPPMQIVKGDWGVTKLLGGQFINVNEVKQESSLALILACRVILRSNCRRQSERDDHNQYRPYDPF